MFSQSIQQKKDKNLNKLWNKQKYCFWVQKGLSSTRRKLIAQDAAFQCSESCEIPLGYPYAPPTSEQQLTLKDAQFLFWSKYFSSRELRHIKSRNPLFLVQGLGRGRPRSSKVKSDHRATQNEVYYNPCSIHVMRGSRKASCDGKANKKQRVSSYAQTGRQKSMNLFIFFLESYLYSRFKPSIEPQSG